ncbi:MAG TPA: rhodanese-like domain-containing protein [Candidatus Paceibacterota bacterium]|nr:rhodanese-like domain-containing protein [Candidatus Paceibacterota bacterium]
MKNPKLIIVLLAMVAFAGLILTARAELSETEARERLKKGAVVVDVRTVEEFKAGHLNNVTNIPLDEVTARISQVVTNKGDVVLVHCRTGRRSGMAETKLRELGYTNVFNIGSFEKARKILGKVSGK